MKIEKPVKYPNLELSNRICIAADLLIMKMEASNNITDEDDYFAETVFQSFSFTADNWYFPNAHPKVILSAVFLNSVYEDIEDRDRENVENFEFWEKFIKKYRRNREIMTKEWDAIQHNFSNVQIDIDEWHNKFKEE